MFFDAWADARPDSYAARVGRGAYLYRRAWTLRGSKSMRDTTEEGVAGMRVYLARAEVDLRAALELSARPQMSQRYLIGIAMARGERATAGALYAEAVRTDAANFASRRAYLHAVRPQWGGSMARMQAVVDEANREAARSPKMRAVAAHLRALLSWQGATDAWHRKDLAAARRYFDQAVAEIDDAFVLAYRGQFLKNPGAQQAALRDFNRALELEPNLPDALEHRATIHEGDNRMSDALADYRRAAVHGSTYAMQRLGIIYMTEVPKNWGEAARWLQLGVAYGDPQAQAYLGYLHTVGGGVARDGRRALELWYASAAQGNEDARKYLDEVHWIWRLRFKIEEAFSK